jgi:hypothetical protein
MVEQQRHQHHLQKVLVEARKQQQGKQSSLLCIQTANTISSPFPSPCNAALLEITFRRFWWWWEEQNANTLHENNMVNDDIINSHDKF